MVHSEENHHDVVEPNYQMWLIPDRGGTDFADHERGFSPEEREGRSERDSSGTTRPCTPPRGQPRCP